MGLSIHIKQGKHYPVLTCDTCGQPIEKLEKALALTPNIIGEPFLAVQGIYHKGICDPESPHLGNSRQKEHMLWIQLDEYIPWLLWNNKWGTRQTTKQGHKIIVDVPTPINL